MVNLHGISIGFSHSNGIQNPTKSLYPNGCYTESLLPWPELENLQRQGQDFFYYCVVILLLLKYFSLEYFGPTIIFTSQSSCSNYKHKLTNKALFPIPKELLLLFQNLGILCLVQHSFQTFWYSESVITRKEMACWLTEV